MLLFVIVLLALFQFGWVIWPELSFYYGLTNTVIIVGILACGVLARRKPVE